MKKIFFFVALTATAFGQNSFAQDNTNKNHPSQLLTQYYAVKDALVRGNSATAAAKAADFIKIANAMEAQSLPGASRTALLKDATGISRSKKDLKKQREYFAGFSGHMFELAETTSLSSAPIYKAYCPMKKAIWLSNEATIKNPYYGSAMLTCGKVVDTLK